MRRHDIQHGPTQRASTTQPEATEPCMQPAAVLATHPTAGVLL